MSNACDGLGYLKNRSHVFLYSSIPRDWNGGWTSNITMSCDPDGVGNPANSLNVYLIELRENRRLRTNERDRTTVGFDVYETPSPRRVDCHYLISAWSPVAATPGIDPTFDEHALLAEAARVVGQFDSLDPVPICAAARPPGLVPVPVPARLQGETLPLVLLPLEGFPKYAEFWGTMGADSGCAGAASGGNIPARRSCHRQ